MLELKNLKKDYPAGDDTVHALKGINLQFRKSEFVSVLGPSGCGKTTMLNIIGGLDKYTDGDLIINGRSTKDFKDRDWDTYRNHSIGFVFQSYNLIPHQTVLQNVELALSLSGVDKTERRKRAKEALERVGLGSQLKKRPGEMSGGQMQRVAIARAIVNDPDIILADEPTGALDTETSIQVMEILKEISRDRLVIMVTHNPDLAEKYSTRIIRVLDGLITDDSKPLTKDEINAEGELEKSNAESDKKGKKPSMSFATSFGLSLNNLLTKKRRTALTSFAGSIGIIGIALITAVSQGMTTYINTMQEDTLSSYPITIEESDTDLGTLMESFMGTGSSGSDHDNSAVYSDAKLYDMLNALNNAETIENDLESFKKYIETECAAEKSALHEAISGIQYTYDLNLPVYTENIDGNIIHSDRQELMQYIIRKYMGVDMSIVNNASGGSSVMSMFSGGGSSKLWQEMLPGDNGKLISPLLEKQYDVVYGSWPAEYNEIVLVLDENNELNDMSLYALGLISEDDIADIVDAVMNGAELENNSKKWTYEEICNMEFRTVLNSDCYVLDEKTGLYSDQRETETGLRYLYDNAAPLKVSGIIRPCENAVATMLSGSIAYTSKLTEYIIGESRESDAVNAQLDEPDIDIFTGLPFKESTGNLSDGEKETEFRAYIADMSEKSKADTYVKIMSIPTEEQLSEAVSQAMTQLTPEDMKSQVAQVMMQQTSMSEADITEYVDSMSEEELNELVSKMVTEQVKLQFAEQVQQQLNGMSTSQLAAALDMAMDSYTTEQCADYYEVILEFSDSDYETNLKKLDCLYLEKPASINIYASSFENKDVIEDMISAYNENVDELQKIKYTDYVGLMMSSVTSIINAVTYVLIAFVAVSLIVSSIMIGVITLISVQERTKEIGILRAIGASKKNVSGMFNAETIIIGFISGMLGVIITYLLCIPINIILQSLTGINCFSAQLPVLAAVILVVISTGLTLFAGIIPSRSAAKKDPVVALRTE